LPRPIIKSHPEEKVKCPWAINTEAPKYLVFPYNIFYNGRAVILALAELIVLFKECSVSLYPEMLILGLDLETKFYGLEIVRP